MSEQAGRYQRSAGGLFGAMLVLAALVLGWVGLRALTSADPATPVRSVDYAQELAAARTSPDLDAVAPASLPRGWRATTVRYEPATPHWHLGVLTERSRYVGLEQGRISVRAMVSTYVDEQPTRGEPVDVAGQPWSTYTDSGGDLGLVRRSGGTTTLVVGHEVERGTLVSYAASLR